MDDAADIKLQSMSNGVKEPVSNAMLLVVTFSKYFITIILVILHSNTSEV
jgi:hypothetical protein